MQNPATTIRLILPHQRKRDVYIRLRNELAFDFDPHGLVGGGRAPFPYFPGNGGLLYAVAMMAAGWDGAPAGDAPGFPEKGWVVRSEGLRRAL